MDHEHVDEIFKRSSLSALLPVIQSFRHLDYRTYRLIGHALFEAYLAGINDTMAKVESNLSETTSL